MGNSIKVVAACSLFAGATLIPNCSKQLDTAHCSDLCTTLANCDLLPSALGVGETVNDQKANCIARCQASKEQQEEKFADPGDDDMSDADRVLECWTQITKSKADAGWCEEQTQCSVAATCLHSLLPAAGGQAELVIQPRLVNQSGGVADGCVSELPQSDQLPSTFCGVPANTSSDGLAAGGSSANTVELGDANRTDSHATSAAGAGNTPPFINSIQLLLPTAAKAIDARELSLKCDEALTQSFPVLRVPAGQYRIRLKVLGARGGANSVPFCTIVQSAFVTAPAGRRTVQAIPIPTDLALEIPLLKGAWVQLTCEDCTDGFDNDGDGLTDCSDPACSCNAAAKSETATAGDQ